MRVDLILVTEKGKSFHEVLLVITQKKTIYAAHSRLLVNIFSRALQNIWRIINTIASTLRKNMYGYLCLDITCFSKLKVFIKLRSRKTLLILDQIVSVDNPSIFSRPIEAIVNLAHDSEMNSCLKDILKQWENRAQKDYSVRWFIYSCKNYDNFERKFCASCSKGNGKGYAEFEQSIRARLQGNPLF